MANIWAVPLALSNFNIVVAFLGGFISLFGLVSYLLKENYYLSEARECSSRLCLLLSPFAVFVVFSSFCISVWRCLICLACPLRVELMSLPPTPTSFGLY